MIILSQDKKTILFLEEIEMLKICPENIFHNANDIKRIYTVKLYPKLKDYFDSKTGKANYCIEMAKYNTEEQAIAAIKKIIDYKNSNCIFEFPQNLDTIFSEAKTAIDKYSDTSYL